MEILNSPIKELVLLKPSLYKDERGDFIETYNQKEFTRAGVTEKFVQDNQSRSKKNVLRGLHFQLAPFEQGKLIRVVKGEVLDVAVDIRKYSATYLQYYAVLLSEENNYQLWIPPGFAHGFLSLKDDTVVNYKCTQFYNKNSDAGIRWNDPDIGIAWGINNPILSVKDSELPFLKEYEISIERTEK
ncbi:MAG: dTDP-4-dehydrorhamnose 3,5-epimerase [Bacteroidia bacterium]|nr:dTDP-4-dehydrorhamnose 3,5-epimerase [Bacteroidia bacterium]